MKFPILVGFFLLLLSISAAAASLPSGEEILRRSPEGIRFSSACEPGQKITIAAVGDVLLHRIVQLQTFVAPERFAVLWHGITDLLQRTDLTYANLEGPTARGVNKSQKDVPDPGYVFDNDVYSGLPKLNYHPSLLPDLLAAGVDVVSTGNNHALDRGPLGLERTIEALKESGLKFSGTRVRSDTRPDWHVITETDGIRIAWISCTYKTNGHHDPYHLVLKCYDDGALIEKLIRKIVDKRQADAVFVVPHWGTQFVHVPEPKQIRFARRFLEAGALAVIGSHPHVIQPWERVITRDGRETFIIYSLGNFVSGHQFLNRRSTVVLNLGLTRTQKGDVILNGVQYTPLIMTGWPGGTESPFKIQAIDRHPLRDEPGEVLEAKNLLLGILGTKNLAPADAPLVTNPECEGR